MANSSTKDALHSITKHNNISVSGAADSQVLRFNGTNWVNTASASALSVTQSSHGFSVGDVLRSSGSDGAYAKAQANNAANAEVLGIITAVPDVNTFTLTVAGYITTAAAVPNETAGSALFLSAATAGELTATEPSTAGQISKPVAIVTTANTSMILVAYRGETLSSGYNNWDVNGSELILDADGDTSLTADTDDQIDVKISGADDFRFTANNFNVLSGSTITIDSGATITNSGTATGFDTDTNTTYSTSWVDSSANAILRLTPSSGSADDLTIVAGTNITLTPSGDNLTITAAAGSDTTYTTAWVDSSNDAILRLTAGGSGSGNDDLTIVAGSNITLTPSGDNLTIAASAGATLSGSTNNTIVTVTGADAIQGEAELTYYNGTLEIDYSGVASFNMDGTGQATIRLQNNGATKWEIGMDGDGSSHQKTSVDDFTLYNNTGSGIYRFVIQHSTGSIGTQGGLALSGAAIQPGGIQFPATQVANSSANNLDEYEEGNFTPAAMDDELNVSDGGFSRQVGWYVRIGRICHIHGQFIINNIGSLTGGDAARIGGLPFVGRNESYQQAVVTCIGGTYNITAGTAVSGFVNTNTSYIHLQLWDVTAGLTQLTINELGGATGSCTFSATYEV